jgi:hypothetical protein
MLIVTCNGAPVRIPGRLPPTADSFTRATWMAKIDAEARGQSLGAWDWQAIRRRDAATAFEAQTAEHETAWQARRGDCIYTILEIPDGITFSAH